MLLLYSQAIEEYKQLEEARLKCFRECESSPTQPFTDQGADEKLRFFFKVVSRANCIKHCQGRTLGLVPWGGVSHYVLNQLQNKDSYNYLQMSLYKVSWVDKTIRNLCKNYEA